MFILQGTLQMHSADDNVFETLILVLLYINDRLITCSLYNEGGGERRRRRRRANHDNKH